jgi:hypothetical protein
MVNPFPYSQRIIKALETSLSPERLSTYLAAANGDHAAALRLYVWNTEISAAFYGPLQGLEIVVRNAFHRELAAVYGPTWYDNPQVPCPQPIGILRREGAAPADNAQARTGAMEFVPGDGRVAGGTGGTPAALGLMRIEDTGLARRARVHSYRLCHQSARQRQDQARLTQRNLAGKIAAFIARLARRQ